MRLQLSLTTCNLKKSNNKCTKNEPHPHIKGAKGSQRHNTHPHMKGAKGQDPEEGATPTNTHREPRPLRSEVTDVKAEEGGHTQSQKAANTWREPNRVRKRSRQPTRPPHEGSQANQAATPTPARSKVALRAQQ